MTINEKIAAREQMIIKLQKDNEKYDKKISANKEKIKALQAEIEKLNLEGILSIAKNANLGMTEVRSLLSDLVNNAINEMPTEMRKWD